MIFHIIDIETWKQIRQQSLYEPSSVEKEGFIHCSTSNQVITVANSLYKGRTDLLLLGIEEELVQADIVYEDLYELDQLYPHIYGPLNIHAVTTVYRLLAEESGEFLPNYSEWDAK